jgi:hypothetical protein
MTLRARWYSEREMTLKEKWRLKIVAFLGHIIHAHIPSTFTLRPVFLESGVLAVVLSPGLLLNEQSHHDENTEAAGDANNNSATGG